MKKYVHAAKEENVLEIVIDLCYDFGENITASFDPNLTDFEINEVIDEMAEEQYMCLMSLVVNKLSSMGFEILDGPTMSNRQGSRSCYFTLCNEDDFDNLTVNFILNVRVSDHRLKKCGGRNNNWDRYEAAKKYRDKELENYRWLNEENPQDMEHYEVEIFVSGNKCHTYFDALNHIVKQVKLAMGGH